jgi:hypothetical protein
VLILGYYGYGHRQYDKGLKTVCPKGMQFFLAQVEQGKEIVCGYLRVSAVN